ncbi:hypothetical protein [uncultured Litoreibacter sp.]|uniref:hypothetical protein n=1 Tax=uncultured Litoreibacter sp. TaxID=1392394 RepID=UPI00260193F0|nr:hypothetical protein [uncultured Litoreibacter sp.]
MARIWLAGWLSLAIAALTHEVVSFGIYHGFLTGERDLLFYLYPSSLGEIIGVTFFTSALCALPLTLFSYLCKPRRLRLIGLGAIWTSLCVWQYYMTAFEYRAHFGATWLSYEPFWELMWSPWLTPLATLLGLVPFLWIIRHR